MDQILDAIISRPDTSLSVLVLIAVIVGLLWLIKHIVTSHKEAMVPISASLQQMATVITELRIDAAKGKR